MTLNPTEELIPIEPNPSEKIPELEDESRLVAMLAVTAIDPAAARAYARKKYLIYAFVLLFCIGMPLAVFSIVSLGNIATPLRHAGIYVVLGAFVIFFYVMIGTIMSRHRILKNLGLSPVEKINEAPSDVNILASRHGRILECGFSQKGCFWRFPKAAPVFILEYRGGLFYSSMTAPNTVKMIFSELPKSRLWRKLRIESGPQGLRLSRPIRMSKFFLHDLWLLEKVLAALKI